MRAYLALWLFLELSARRVRRRRRAAPIPGLSDRDGNPVTAADVLAMGERNLERARLWGEPA